MFFRIMGMAWIVLGIWWILRPQSIRKRFGKNVKKARRKIIILAVILLAGLFFSAAKYAHGILAGVFLVIGIITILKAVFFLASKASGKLLDWWGERPLWMWRVWAGAIVVIGLLLQKIR